MCIGVLAETNQMLQLLCTETIANLAKFRKARRLVRRHGGLPRLIDLLDIGDHSRVSIYTENYLYMYIFKMTMFKFKRKIYPVYSSIVWKLGIHSRRRSTSTS